MEDTEEELREKPRLLGLDYGTKTVGVAVSDGLGLTAQGVEIIRRERADKLRSTLRRIEELVLLYHPVRIVLGMPYNMDGTEGFRVQETRKFGDLLTKRTGLPVAYCDERLTTVEAYEIMQETKVPRQKQKDYVDEIAAVLILKAYMAEHPL